MVCGCEILVKKYLHDTISVGMGDENENENDESIENENSNGDNDDNSLFLYFSVLKMNMRKEERFVFFVKMWSDTSGPYKKKLSISLFLFYFEISAKWKAQLD